MTGSGSGPVGDFRAKTPADRAGATETSSDIRPRHQPQLTHYRITSATSRPSASSWSDELNGTRTANMQWSEDHDEIAVRSGRGGCRHSGNPHPQAALLRMWVLVISGEESALLLGAVGDQPHDFHPAQFPSAVQLRSWLRGLVLSVANGLHILLMRAAFIGRELIRRPPPDDAAPAGMPWRL